jgi:enoyl-CoA hydratase
VTDRLLVTRDRAITTVMINRPDVRNAVDVPTFDQLITTFAEISRDRDVRCVILTGAGDQAFIAGADVKAMASLDVSGARAFSERGQRAGDMMEALSVPVIAAVNGYALGGGCELALACDFIYAARTARLGQPEVNLGVIPGMGATQRLVRRVGIARARELLYTGAILDADEALRIGLVNAVFEPAELLPRARAAAETIAAKAPRAVAAAKQALRQGAGLGLDAGLELERGLFATLFGTQDQKEGMRAFVEKRPPVWSNR